MCMKARVIVPLTALSFVIVSSVWSAASASGSQLAGHDANDSRAARLVSALDECLQDRFRDVNERFGFSRILRPEETTHRFKPENLREMMVVRDLERANLRVVFYLAGRGVLIPNIAHRESGWRVIKGPVHITSVPSARSSDAGAIVPPRPSDLWDESQRAMRAFETGDLHQFVKPGWTFVARPVRAADTMCLRCHGGSVKRGEAIGAAIYGYR
jgi:hypothetical protein